MSSTKAHVALFVDFEALSVPSGTGAAPAPGEVAAALLRYASGVGRVTLARGYADWSTRPDDLRAVQAARVAPVLSPRGPRGEDRAHVRLVVDALEALFAGGEPDAIVVASADGRLLPLVQALRADGCEVLYVAPAVAPVDDVRHEADTTATLEEVLGGAVGPASTPRPDVEAHDDEEDDDAAPEPAPAHGPSATPALPFPSRDRAGGGHGRPMGPPGRGFGPPRGGFRAAAPAAIDFASYDWKSFVQLIDELEHRLPFVGVRYLVNKVLGVRNCGVDDPRLKRDLINKAVDEGILEMHEVGNVGERADPVTACRLDRQNPVVVEVLGTGTRTPVVPEHKPAEPPPGGFVEGGLPLDASTEDGD
ncbi:MAG TPA: NYN domain-containing protein [Planctomycetota bacterium]|nr:NYN domain-containing protein [Planctomycetota bacterium]